MLVARAVRYLFRGPPESCVYRHLGPVNTGLRTQPRPAEDDHRGSRDQRAIATRLSATQVKGSGRPGQQAQKPKMLETQAITDSHVPPRTTTTFLRLLAGASPNRTAESAQTLKPRALSWSRPSSVIISMPHGGIQTQLITHRSTKPSSAV